MLVATSGITWLSREHQRTASHHFYQGLTQTLAEILRPSLAISDYGEAQRLLKIAEGKQKVTIGLVTAYGDILMADYAKRSHFEAIAAMKEAFSCESVLKRFRPIASSYFPYCAAINSQDGLGVKPTTIGLVVVMATLPSPFFSGPYFFGWLIGFIVAILAIGLWLSRKLRRQIVIPIEDTMNLMESASLQPEGERPELPPQPTIVELGRLNQSFLSLIERFRQEHIKRQEQETVIKMATAKHDLAAQVAHDIRSPLAALEAIVGAVNKLPEEERLIIRSAVNRIKDIANHLLEKNRGQAKGEDGSWRLEDGGGKEKKDPSPSPTDIYLLSSLIEPLITEKRLQFRSHSSIDITANLDASSYGLFAKVEPREFKRVLSNLINNSVEALKEKGSVTVNLASDKDWVLLKVQDNGPGIPKEILAKIGQRGQTHGKAQGSGLGLYHARCSLEAWEGSLEMTSKWAGGQKEDLDSGLRRNDSPASSPVLRAQGGEIGTTVTIKLPKAPSPSWFISELVLAPQSPVVILDDDSTIHQVWQGRLDSLCVSGQGIEVRHCSTPQDLRSWVKKNPQQSSQAIYLTDFELLGFKETGLALIEELGLGEHAILVTSRYEEDRILKDCLRLGVRLIPKNLVGFVPIRITTENITTSGPLHSSHPLSSVSSESKSEEGLDSRLRGNDRPAGSPVTTARNDKSNGRYAVLIDDDKLVQMTWRMAAKGAGIELSSFNSPQDFEKAHSTIARNTPIYLDSSFPNNQKGEDFLPRLKELGFTQITMATGFEADAPALKSLGIPVIGKEPPFAAPSLRAGTYRAPEARKELRGTLDPPEAGPRQPPFGVTS